MQMWFYCYVTAFSCGKYTICRHHQKKNVKVLNFNTCRILTNVKVWFIY